MTATRLFVVLLLTAACAHSAANANQSGMEITDKGMAGGRDDMNCPLCEYLVVLLQQQLDPDTEKYVIAQAEEVCQSLPEDMQSSCLQYIASAGKDFFDWIQTSDPGTLCNMIGVCTDSQSAPLLPALSAAFKDKLNQLRVGDGDQCNTCQLVIIEASAILSDPGTQKEILDYVKQSCKDFEAFEEQCESYVDLYGPTVLNVAKQYLKPELCTQLGFCPPSMYA